MRPVFHSASRLLPVPGLFVAADLSTFQIERMDLSALGDEVTQPGDDDVMCVYRRLDLRWYQWLYHRMAKVQAKVTAGEIPDADWQIMRTRFTIVWRWMRANYLAIEIADAEASYPDARYLPPLMRDARKYLALFASPHWMHRMEAVSA